MSRPRKFDPNRPLKERWSMQILVPLAMLAVWVAFELFIEWASRGGN